MLRLKHCRCLPTVFCRKIPKGPRYVYGGLLSHILIRIPNIETLHSSLFIGTLDPLGMAHFVSILSNLGMQCAKDRGWFRLQEMSESLVYSLTL